MPICTNCGNELEEGLAFCTNCGTPVEGNAAGKANAAGAPTQVNKPVEGGASIADQPTTSYPNYDAAKTVAIPSSGALAAASDDTVVLPPTDTTYHAGASRPPVSYVAGPGSTAQMPAQPAPQPQPAQTQGQYVSQPAQSGTSNKTVIIVVAIVAVVVIAVAIILAVNLTGGKDEAPAPTATMNEQVNDTPAKPESATEQEPPSDANAQAPVTNTDGYILPESDSRYLTESDLSSLSDHDLYLARNEIFARHGRGFKSDDLKQYFNSQPWYTQIYSPEEFDALDNVLNDYEMKNSQLIRSVEERRNSPYLS